MRFHQFYDAHWRHDHSRHALTTAQAEWFSTIFNEQYFDFAMIVGIHSEDVAA